MTKPHFYLNDNSVSMIVTFYSYKGGVGRSMALANIAELLYRQNKRVVIIDWDLEAPGVESYFFNRGSDLDRIAAQKGLIDILEAYKESYPRLITSKSVPATRKAFSHTTRVVTDTLTALENLQKDGNPVVPEEVTRILHEGGEYEIDAEHVTSITHTLNQRSPEGDSGEHTIPDRLREMLEQKTSSTSDVDEALLENELPSFLPLLQPLRGPGNYKGVSRPPGIWLISAGQRDEENFSGYVRSVQDFDWNEFYKLYGGMAYFNWMRKVLREFADYVLIDSRTGVTEMGGVCTRHMADKVVMLTAPNPQNVSGTVEMMRSIKRAVIEKIRKTSVDVMVVPCRLDNSELRDLNNFKADFLARIGGVIGNDRALQFWELGIPYVPYYTFHDELVAGASTQEGEELKTSTKSAVLEKAYLKIVTAMTGSVAAPVRNEDLRSPFRGLMPYEEKDADLFFGRSLEASRVIDALDHNPLVILTGPSGSGKTSLLRAGIIPGLKNKKKDINIVFGRGATLKEQLDEMMRKNEQPPDVLIVDQVEEMVWLHKEDEAGVLADVLRRGGKCVLAVRLDAMESLLPVLKQYHSAEPEIVRLGNLGAEELRRILIALTSKAGLVFEDGLVERILQDCGDNFSILPLLQVLLQELWSRRKDNVLTHRSYDELGRLGGMWWEYINTQLKDISEKELNRAKPVLTRMVDPFNLMRTVVRTEDIGVEGVSSVQPFINRRIVVLHRDAKTGAEYLSFSHDVILSRWLVLQDWLNDEKEFLAWRRRLSLRVIAFETSRYSTEYLLNENEFHQAHVWMKRRPEELTEGERNFIDRSRQSMFRRRIIKYNVIAVSVALIIAAVIGVTYYTNRSAAARTLQAFQQSLDSLQAKTGRARDSAACQLSQFNNTYHDAYIERVKNTLLKQCLAVTASVAQTQYVVGQADQHIETLKQVDTFRKTEPVRKQIDKLEDSLNKVTVQLATGNRNPAMVNDSIELSKKAYAIISNNKLLSAANSSSHLLDSAIKARNDTTAKTGVGMADGYPKSAFFKKGYYLVFDNIKIYLSDLNKGSQRIVVEICNLSDAKSCDNPTSALLTPNGQPFTFSMGNYQYSLQLDRIGSGGLNPFTPAAFITFSKYKRL